MAVTVDGERDILGLRAGDGGEGSKFWLHVLTEIKNRGVGDALMVVCDGLKGLPQAIETVWPQAVVQTSSVELGVGGNVPLVHSHRPGHDLCRRVPSRSRRRPVGPGRRRASHRSAGVALRAPR
jgi:hypothetical protein